MSKIQIFSISLNTNLDEEEGIGDEVAGESGLRDRGAGDDRVRRRPRCALVPPLIPLLQKPQNTTKLTKSNL